MGARRLSVVAVVTVVAMVTIDIRMVWLPLESGRRPDDRRARTLSVGSPPPEPGGATHGGLSHGSIFTKSVGGDDEEELSGLESQWTEILHLPAAIAEREPNRSVEKACWASSSSSAAGNGSLWTTVNRERRTMRAVIFVHIPKCGGSALTTVLRRMACEANRAMADAAADCCRNPGFCQRNTRPDKHRTCRALPGCHGHNPQLRLYAAKPGFGDVKAVAMVRDPVSRVISAWHYRCHNPNFDCFRLPGAAQWGLQMRRARGQRLPDGVVLPGRNVTFAEYVDRWPQYHNIQTRMLGRDSFPYEAQRLEEADLARAIGTCDTRFALVAVFELYDHSVALLARLAGVALVDVDFQRVRAAHSEIFHSFKRKLLADRRLVAAVRAANDLDGKLHEYAKGRLCAELRSAGFLGSPAGCPPDFARAERRHCASA